MSSYHIRSVHKKIFGILTKIEFQYLVLKSINNKKLGSSNAVYDPVGKKTVTHRHNAV